MISYALLATLAALQVADIWTTRKILLAGGRELNPAVRWLIGRFGIMPALVVSKAAVLAIAWFILLPYPAVLAALCAFYGWIVWHNWRSL